MKEAFAAAASNADLTPLDFMLGVMKDTTVLPELRLKAAETAAAYVHAKPGRSQASDPAVSAKSIEEVREARDRVRLLELVLAEFSKGLSGGEAEELERLREAYPPDPNNPMREAFEAWGRVARGEDPTTPAHSAQPQRRTCNGNDTPPLAIEAEPSSS